MKEFFLKNLPPMYNFETIEILKQLALSHKSLAELKGYSSTIPNKNILINAMTINEAKDSSEIENIITTHDDIYMTIVRKNKVISPAVEVLNYRKAILHGYDLIKRDNILTINKIIEIQSIIEENDAGIRKIPGTELRNEATGEVVYVPPVGENAILDYMTNLERYINNDDFHGIDHLLKLAIIHYQFESIHPFYDGNGRTGRIINILYLVMKKLLDSPILYLSRFINNNKSAYYDSLQGIRDKNDWEKYILFMLRGIEETSITTLSIIRQINSLFDQTLTIIKQKLPKIYSKELVELLFYEFYTKIDYLVEGLGVTRKTASGYLMALESIGILKSERVGRNIVYVNIELFNTVKRVSKGYNNDMIYK